MSVYRRSEHGENLYIITGHEPGNLFDDPEWRLYSTPLQLKNNLQQIAMNHGGYVYTSIKEYDFATGIKKEILRGKNDKQTT